MIFKGFSLKQTKLTFMEAESPTLNTCKKNVWKLLIPNKYRNDIKTDE